jgi:hypothetical protein
MRKAMFVLALAVLGGCDGLTGPSEPAAAYVKIVDNHGDLLRPDRVVWYYPPESSLYDGEHPATCINGGCSVWAVPVGVTGDVYVYAVRNRPYPGDPYCVYTGYDASPVVASENDPPTVVLRLEMALGCA